MIRSTTSEPLNLAEVKVFNGQTQLARSSLTFTLSSTLGSYVAGICNDGDLTNFCHTENISIDQVRSLTIGTGFQNFDRIVVYNRNGYLGRIVGGTIKVIGLMGTVYNSWTFDTEASTYTFTVGTTVNHCQLTTYYLLALVLR